MKSHLKIKTRPAAKPENIIQGERYRVTVLTDSLVRLEYSPEGYFVDEATQIVLNRDFPQVHFTLKETEEELEIRTDCFQLNYDKKEFSGRGLSCICTNMGGDGMAGLYSKPWHYGEKSGNLKGTTRTLDEVNGACELEDGLMSFWCGVAMLDDSHSLLLGEDGWVETRKHWELKQREEQRQKQERELKQGEEQRQKQERELKQGEEQEQKHEQEQKQELKQAEVNSAERLFGELPFKKEAAGGQSGKAMDIYIFAYGHRYREALKAFNYLCGKTPMLPRFALGNWWSRYYKYTEDSYMELMHRFDEEEVPFSVAVIDMDWHLVDIDQKYGSGWTGYTWNRELFPDPERFLKKLHERGMKITLNVHPADGIRAYEECYSRTAQAMGVDASKEEAVKFDIADSKFLEVYFDEVHHPLEAQGVDFWWLDWQQGTNTKVEGLDPLWMLNHYHFLDSGRDGKRPMTFSRYAGPGSHRYPVGFSGDTVITWESLDFQPYFTNTASNIGYGWWSHDIGGHMMGYKNDELEARWYQYGVFSPINRLHSTCNPFNGKEPWRFKREVHDTMNDFLRLRHKLIPYLYTMNYRAWSEDIPLCQPLYYEYPAAGEAYRYRNQYLFGSELMAAPITSQRIEGLNVAEVKAWLPKGLWFDFFTNMAYEGDRSLCMYRGIDKMPVLAKAGAIIPMTEKISAHEAAENPSELTVRVYPGADNCFILYEDDNVSPAYQKNACVKTELNLDWNSRCFSIEPAVGETSLIPKERAWKIELHKITCDEACVLVNGKEREAVCTYKDAVLTVIIEQVRPEDRVEIVFPKETEIAENPVLEMIHDFLNQAEISFRMKDEIYKAAKKNAGNPAALIGELQAMGVPETLQKVILELAA
ncbi:MAG: DUF5110 domain-containing protein [Clostridium sp.]|nr:DUF5110 domain-containing protein [Clostridium sp.]